MSKFKIDEKIRLGYRYDITDENDNPIYYVEGKMLQLVPKLVLHAMDGTPVAHIDRKAITLMPEIDIIIDGQNVAQVREKVAFLKRKLHVGGPEWEIEGDWIGHDYVMKDRDGKEVARAERNLLAFTDKYLLDVFDEENDLIALCSAIAMDREQDETREETISLADMINSR